MSAGSGKGEEDSGSRDATAPRPFAAVMREWQMTAPPALLRSIDDACRGESSQNADPHHVLGNAEQLLDRVLDGACESRDSALDLLTIDALVTRAMESAVRDPEVLAEFPELAMKRLSSR